MRRLGFTMIELIFVIVIMGIIGKFGVEFLAQAYRGFIFSNVNHNLQANGEMAVESIASRLQYRIKDSVIKRQSANFLIFEAIGATVPPGTEQNYNILEWVGSDIDSFRGDTLPYWSGIIDLDASRALGTATLISPETNTTAINNMIVTLSNNTTDLNDSAIYFIGSDSDIDNYGWANNAGVGAFRDQNMSIHPIRNNGNLNQLIPKDAATGLDNTFANFDVYEYYQLAWTAYAVGIDNYNVADGRGTLTLWYNYQPWNGESRFEGNSTVIMENVSTFRFKSVGSIIKIQVCVNSDIVEDYSLCKEKTIF